VAESETSTEWGVAGVKFHHLNPVQRQQTQNMYADNKFSSPPHDNDGYDYTLDDDGNVAFRAQIEPTCFDCGEKVVHPHVCKDKPTGE